MGANNKTVFAGISAADVEQLRWYLDDASSMDSSYVEESNAASLLRVIEGIAANPERLSDHRVMTELLQRSLINQRRFA